MSPRSPIRQLYSLRQINHTQSQCTQLSSENDDFILYNYAERIAQSVIGKQRINQGARRTIRMIAHICMHMITVVKTCVPTS